MSEHHSAWDDPDVKAALKQRDAGHIALICCGNCHCYSYYNEGSHFSCQWCDWSVSGEDLDDVIEAGEVISLDDYTDMTVNGEDVP